MKNNRKNRKIQAIRFKNNLKKTLNKYIGNKISKYSVTSVKVDKIGYIETDIRVLPITPIEKITVTLTL